MASVVARLFLVFGLFGLCVAILACGGDGAPSTSAPAASADLPPKVGGVEAMRSYLLTSGLDGNKGKFTDPINCADLPSGVGDGDYCVIDAASVYAPGLVILFVADAHSQQNNVWQVHINRNSAGWQVGEVAKVEPPSNR